MGGEFGQRREWQHDESLDWHVLQYPLHAGVQRWVRDLNHLYRSTPALHELDFTDSGFEWIDCDDADVERDRLPAPGQPPATALLVACNFTPVPRSGYRIGVPRGGRWRERLNSDAARLRRQRPGQPRRAGRASPAARTATHGRCLSVQPAAAGGGGADTAD